MSRPISRFFHTLWQAAALITVIALTALLLHNAYRQYYSSVYPIKYQDEVAAASNNFGIEPSLIYAIIHTESSFNPQAISSADAKGLMQLTDSTFKWALDRAGENGVHTSKELFVPSVNIHYGVYVLVLLGEQFKDIETVLAAYNAGQGRVAEWLGDKQYSSDGIHLHTIPYPETEVYVRRVLETQKYYQQLYSIQ